jgi:hypothetical protein
LSDFWAKVADAYQLIALQAEASQRKDLEAQMTVRAMRAIFHQMRLGLMRYAGRPERACSQVGAEIFSKDPQLLWMKKLGLKQDQAWNWQVRDQKSMQHFTQAVLLAPDPGSGRESSLLLTPESYCPEEAFAVMVDNAPRRLQIGAVVEKSDGFERVAFKWLAVDPRMQMAPPAAETPAAPPPTKSAFMDDAT